MKFFNKNKWSIVRAKNRAHFIVFRGALGFGVKAAVLWLLIMWLFTPHFNVIHMVPIAIVLWPVGGLAWGGFMWWSMERIYAKQVRNS